MHPARRRGLP